MIFVKVGLEVWTVGDKALRVFATVVVEDHHHSRECPSSVAEWPRGEDLDYRLAEEVGCPLLDGWRNLIDFGLEEPDPRVMHPSSPHWKSFGNWSQSRH